MSSAPVLEQADVLPAIRDPERLAVLERTGLLDGGSDPVFDRLARLAAALVGTPVSFVSLVGLERQVMPGAAAADGGDPMRELPLDESFCQYSVATREPIIIEDARQDPLVRNNPSVRRAEVGAYAGVPLATEQGHVLGALCVLDRDPRRFDERQLALLRDLAALVELEFDHRLTAGRILGVQGLGRRVADQVDVLGDSLTSLVELAEQQENPRLQRYAAVTRSRFAAVTETVRELRDAAAPAPAETPGPSTSAVDLRRVVERAVGSVRAVTRSNALTVAVTPIPLVVECDPLQLERAISHVLVTALHHTAPDTPVEVRIAPAHAGSPEGKPMVAELTVVAPEGRIPAAELGRVVSRFQASRCDEATAEDAPAAVRVARGAVVAESGRARGRSSTREGTQFRARWSLRHGQQPGSITLP